MCLSLSKYPCAFVVFTHQQSTPELGHLAAAKEAFNEVIRATSRTKGFVKLPEAYINMGHLGLAKKQYADALRMYEHAGRLNNQRDVKVCLCVPVYRVYGVCVGCVVGCAAGAEQAWDGECGGCFAT